MVPDENLCSQCRHKSVSSQELAEAVDMEISDIEDIFEENFLAESIRSLLNSTLCDLEVSH